MCHLTPDYIKIKINGTLLHLLVIPQNITMHGIINIKYIEAKQARAIFHFKNTKRKLYRTNAAIWYNKTCKQSHLTPDYIKIKINGTFLHLLVIPQNITMHGIINIKYLHAVASRWILLIQSHDARNHKCKITLTFLPISCIELL